MRCRTGVQANTTAPPIQSYTIRGKMLRHRRHLCCARSARIRSELIVFAGVVIVLGANTPALSSTSGIGGGFYLFLSLLQLRDFPLQQGDVLAKFARKALAASQDWILEPLLHAGKLGAFLHKLALFLRHRQLLGAFRICAALGITALPPRALRLDPIARWPARVA